MTSVAFLKIKDLTRLGGQQIRHQICFKSLDMKFLG